MSKYKDEQLRRLQLKRSFLTADQLLEVDTRSFSENWFDRSARMGTSLSGIKVYFQELTECRRADERMKQIMEIKLTEKQLKKRQAALAAEKTAAIAILNGAA